jgi:hypothetical protein
MRGRETQTLSASNLFWLYDVESALVKGVDQDHPPAGEWQANAARRVAPSRNTKPPPHAGFDHSMTIRQLLLLGMILDKLIRQLLILRQTRASFSLWTPQQAHKLFVVEISSSVIRHFDSISGALSLDRLIILRAAELACFVRRLWAI